MCKSFKGFVIDSDCTEESGFCQSPRAKDAVLMGRLQVPSDFFASAAQLW